MILSASCTFNSEQSSDDIAKTHSNYGKPNIVMIVVDDMRWDEFFAMGHPFLHTPNIDRLAAEGGLFENAFQAVPLCSPNRASILTGQYPSRHGIVDNVARNKASHKLNLFAKDLQKAGYETAHIGKWHMGNDPTPRPGYDYWSCLPGQGRCIDPILYENGKFDTVTGYVTDVLTDKAKTFIEQDRKQPFFLYIGHKAIHPDLRQLDNGAVDFSSKPQFTAAPRHIGKYADAQFKRRKNAISTYSQIDSTSVIGKALIDKNSPEVQVKFGASLLDHFTADQTIRDRSEMLLAIDEGLGVLMETLEEKGILDNTFILFTSDNGYFYGEHGLSVERRLPYDESIRTPLLIRYPPLIKSNTRVKEFALSIDYAPTALMLAGVEVKPYIQGRSLLPLFTGQSENWRKSILVEYYSYENPMPWLIDTDYKAIRTEKYKYIYWVKHENKHELYDLKKDPFEMNNLYGEENMRSIVLEMEELLAKEIVKAFGISDN
ncbi:MAG: sulfatase-like hydrolase/transferase [Bacteroidales bacterium]|nr:sulfatase-like hydrolase/transferase [Bacteroidales bacterium]